MNKRNKIKTMLFFSVMAMAAVCLTAAWAQAAVVVYEPFDYTAGEVLAGDGGIGFDGAWITTEAGSGTNLFTVQDGGLTFTDDSSNELDVAGNSVHRTSGGGRSEANRALSAGAKAALLADGSTIWFSILYQNTNDVSAFLIGTDTYDVVSNGDLDGIPSTAEGFGCGTTSGEQFVALAFDNNNGLTQAASSLDVSTTKLIAGKIVWNANGTNDELYLYNVTDLTTEPTTPIATVIADLDQSAFDLVVLQHKQNAAVFDEIRFAGSFAEVMGGSFDPNVPSVNAGANMITWSEQTVVLDPNVVEADGSDWTSLTYQWTAVPDGIGDPNLDVSFTGANTENATVTVTKTADTGDATAVTITLAVNNEGRIEEPVTSSMKIKVYDDACKAGIAAGAVLDETDFDGNCITNLADISDMAAAWLVNYESTGPLPR